MIRALVLVALSAFLMQPAYASGGPRPGTPTVGSFATPLAGAPKAVQRTAPRFLNPRHLLVGAPLLTVGSCLVGTHASPELAAGIIGVTMAGMAFGLLSESVESLPSGESPHHEALSAPLHAAGANTPAERYSQAQQQAKQELKPDLDRWREVRRIQRLASPSRLGSVWQKIRPVEPHTAEMQKMSESIGANLHGIIGLGDRDSHDPLVRRISQALRFEGAKARWEKGFVVIAEKGSKKLALDYRGRLQYVFDPFPNPWASARGAQTFYSFKSPSESEGELVGLTTEEAVKVRLAEIHRAFEEPAYAEELQRLNRPVKIVYAGEEDHGAVFGE